MQKERYFAVLVENVWEYFAARNEACIRGFYEASGLSVPGRIREVSLSEARDTAMFSSFERHHQLSKDGTYMLGKKK